MQTFENLIFILFSKTTQTVCLDVAHKCCLSMCSQSLLKWWCHLHYWQSNSKRQFELTANLMQTFENLLLQNYPTEF